MGVLEHLYDLETPTEEFYRVLRPDGIAVIGVPVSNLLTEAMLRLSYLSLDARLDDEHVSTHRDVLAALRKRFSVEKVLRIPRHLPDPIGMYCTVRFRKP